MNNSLACNTANQICEYIPLNLDQHIRNDSFLLVAHNGVPLLFSEFTTNVGPVVSEAEKRKGIPASVVLREVMSTTGSDEGQQDEQQSGSEPKRSTILQRFTPTTIKAILELLCDESVSAMFQA